MKRLKAQMEGLVLKVTQVEEERDRKDREMEDIREEREMLQRRFRDQENRHETQRGTQQHIFQSSPQGVNSRPPKFPLLATKASSWAKRMSLFLQAQGLGYTIQHSTNPMPIISDGDRGSLVRRLK